MSNSERISFFILQGLDIPEINAIIYLEHSRTKGIFMDNTYEKNESLLQVRYYIYNIIRKNGKRSVKIPSSYELAGMFGLTRRVVQRELERLIASGILIGRKRIGTYTKPSPLEMPLFGITYGNGDHFMWGYFEMAMLSAVFQQLSRFECSIHDLKITTRNAANCIQILKSMALNATLWIGTPDWPDGETDKLYKIAAKEKLPFFTCATKLHPGLSGVDFSYRNGLKELQKICKKEKRFKILAISQDRDTYQAFNDEFPNHFRGKEFTVTFQKNKTLENIESSLKRDLKKMDPDVILFPPGFILQCRSLLKDFCLKNSALLVSLGPFIPEMEFDYFYFDNPYQAAAEWLAEELFKREQDPNRIAQIYIEKILKKHERNLS